MTSERLGPLVWNKPEYLSPYFSLEIRQPQEMGEILNQIYRENQFSEVIVGPDTEGSAAAPRVWVEPGRSTLSIGLRLPNNDYFIDFVSDHGLPWLGSRKRGVRLERELHRYVDDEFYLMWLGVKKLRKDIVVRDVAKLPDFETPTYTYGFPKRLFPFDESAASQASFQYALREGLTTFIIYCTELFRYYGISDSLRRIIIDPKSVQITSSTKRQVNSADPFETLKGAKARIIAEVLVGELQREDPLDPQGFFKILGIDSQLARSLSLETLGQLVERSYRTYAVIFHPDVAGDNTQMKKLNEARDFLKNPKNRAKYGRQEL